MQTQAARWIRVRSGLVRELEIGCWDGAVTCEPKDRASVLWIDAVYNGQDDNILVEIYKTCRFLVSLAQLKSDAFNEKHKLVD
jgi:hypothetical protein